MRVARALALTSIHLLVAGMAWAASDPIAVTPKSHQLDNGLQVAVFEFNQVPTVHFRFMVRSGASHEEPEKAGLANLTSQVVFHIGDRAPTATNPYRRIEDLGGDLAAIATHDYSIANARCQARDWREVMSLFAANVQNPGISDAEVSFFKNRVVNGIQQGHRDPSLVAREHFAALLFGIHTYARSDRGDDYSVQALTADDVRDFHRFFWRPNNSVFVVAGDVKAEDVFAAADSLFGSWTRGEIPPRVLAGSPSTETKIRLLYRSGLNPCQVVMGYRGPPRSSDDYFVIQVMNYLFGGSQYSSRLGQEMQARWGDATLATSAWTFGRDGGSFTVSGTVDQRDVQAFVEAVKTVIREFRENPPGPEELEIAKQSLMGSARLGFQSPGAVADRWLQVHVYGLGDDYFSRFQSAVQELTVDDIAECASGYLHDEPMVIVVTGDNEVVEAQLENYGEVELLPFRAATGAIPVTTVTFEPSVEASPENRARVDSIMALVIEKHGGEKRLSQIKTWRVQGQVEMYLTGTPVSGEYAVVVKLPDYHRIDMLLNEQRIIRAVVGDEGWISSGGQVADMTPQDTRTMQLSAYSNPVMLLLTLVDPEVDVRFVGVEENQGKALVILEWVREDLGPARVFINAETNELVALEQTEPSPVGSEAVTVLRLYGDLRNVSGISFPHRVELYMNGAAAFMQTVTKMEFDVDLTDEVFQKPIH